MRFPQFIEAENASQQTLIICSLADLQAVFRDAIAMTPPSEAEEDTTALLTAEEVMKRLHCNRSTLWRWNRDEYLCHKKVGKKNMYLESDINKLMKAQHGNS